VNYLLWLKATTDKVNPNLFLRQLSSPLSYVASGDFAHRYYLQLLGFLCHTNHRINGYIWKVKDLSKTTTGLNVQTAV